MRNPLQPHQVTLRCDYIGRAEAAALLEGSRRLAATPLSLLMRVFGATANAPWFQEGVLLDESMRHELDGCFPDDLAVSTQKCHLRVYGDGQGVLSADHSLAWGLTGYQHSGGPPQLLHLMSVAEKAALDRLFRQHRLRRASPPFKPLVQRVDCEWQEDFLAPLGIQLPTAGHPSAVFFDLWFNTSHHSSESSAR